MVLLSGLRTQRCRELWCTLQVRLGSGVAMAVVKANSCSFDLTPNLGTSICHKCDPEKTKKKKDITIVNIYAPNTGSPQDIRKLLTTLKGEIENNTVIAGDFNIPLTAMDRSSR